MRLSRRMTLGMLGMLGLGIGYFAWYTPYSGLAKGLSGGVLPGVDEPVGGLVLLPASALGMLCAMPVFLLLSGWWRHARSRRIGGVQVPFPGRETAASAFWMALIVATTTLNFTFTGFSIVFMLVMMRISTIILAPAMDLFHRRPIGIFSWAGLGLSLLSAFIALADVTNYRMAPAAFLSLGLYLTGYAGRFHIMGRHAKTGLSADRRYFVEEHMTTPVVLVLLLAIPALVNQGPAMNALHAGFTTFLTGPAAGYGFLIGVCYEGLFIFTTLIFLDRREYAFCMPVHVCASLLAGLVASLALSGLFGTAGPSVAQLVAAACVVLAALTLSYPAMRAWLLAWRRPEEELLLFVCGENVVRSPMAEAIARAELEKVTGRVRRPWRARGAPARWRVHSAGLTAARPGQPMSPEAVEALRRLGVPAGQHSSRRLTPELCRESTRVYCMTEEQRAAISALAPEMGQRTFCLDPVASVAEAPERTVDGHVQLAYRIRQLVRSRLWEHVMLAPVRSARSVAGGQTSAAAARMAWAGSPGDN
jgi:protein-tyrosine-phosphatase